MKVRVLSRAPKLILLTREVDPSVFAAIQKFFGELHTAPKLTPPNWLVESFENESVVAAQSALRETNNRPFCPR